MTNFSFSRFLLIWGVGLLLLFGNISSGYTASIPAQKIEAQLNKIDKSLVDLQKALETVKAEKGKVCAPPEEGSPLAKLYVTFFVEFLQQRIWNLKIGVSALWEHAQRLMTWQMPWEEWLSWGLVTLKFVGALSAGFVINLLTQRSLREPFKLFTRWNRRLWQGRDVLQNVIQAISELFVSFLPLFTGALVQVSSFFLFEETPLLRNGMLSLIMGIFIWGSVWQIQKFLLSQPKKTFLLCYLSTEAQKSLVRKTQLLLFCVIVGGWVGELVTFAGVPEAAQKILMIGFGLGVVIAFFGVTQILKKPILKTLQTQQFQSFTFLTFLWIGIWNSFALLFYGLFILDEQLLASFFWPIIITLLFLPLIPLLYRSFRRGRIVYLWRTRHTHRDRLLYRSLRVHGQMDRLSKILAYSIVGFCIIEIWEFHLFVWLRQIIGDKIYNQILDVLILFLATWTVLSLGDRLLRYYLERSPTTDNTIEDAYLQGRLRTLLRVARMLLRIAVWVTFILLLVSTFGYNVTSLITSLGIVSAALAFGLQSLVKDFVTGFFMLLDNSLMVGDQVEIDGKSGTVEDLSLRTLKIRADNGTLQTIPFGSITVIGNKSRYFAYTLINFTATYDADPEKVTQLLEKAYQTLKRTPSCSRKLLAAEIRGITDVTDYAMVFQARLKTAPGQQDFIKRAYNKVLKQLCDESGVRIPTPPYHGERSIKMPSLTNTV